MGFSSRSCTRESSFLDRTDLPPGQAIPGGWRLAPRRLPLRVRLVRLGRLLLYARTVPRRELRDRVPHAPVSRAGADHQDGARLVAGADEDVLRAGGCVEEIPRAQRALLALDEQRALAREDEKVLLLVLGVVAAVGLARRKDVDADSELLELGHRRLERALRARSPLLTALGREPHRVAEVDDEPPRPRRGEAGTGLLERRLGHGRRGYQPRVSSSSLGSSDCVEMPTIGSPRPAETRARISASRECGGASPLPLARPPRAPP